MKAFSYRLFGLVLLLALLAAAAMLVLLAVAGAGWTCGLAAALFWKGFRLAWLWVAGGGV
jgi:hypothetical protein